VSAACSIFIVPCAPHFSAEMCLCHAGSGYAIEAAGHAWAFWLRFTCARSVPGRPTARGGGAAALPRRGDGRATAPPGGAGGARSCLLPLTDHQENLRSDWGTPTFLFNPLHTWFLAAAAAAAAVRFVVAWLALADLIVNLAWPPGMGDN
jgi:hypothetical protein